MTVVEIGCGRCSQSADLHKLTRDGLRSRKHGVPSVSNEQESASESPRIRLLSARRQVGPGIVNPKQLDRDVHEYTSVTLRMILLR